MAESNNVPQEAAPAALPDNGPWSMTWDKLSQAAGNAAQWVNEKVQNAQDALPKMPWEMSGGELSQNTANRRTVETYTPPAPVEQTQSFSGIFKNIINAESGGKHRDADGNLITSPVGAQGITQLMPATAKDPGYGITPVRNNGEQEYLRVGKSLLNAYTNDLGGDIRKGVAAYNYGIGNVKKLIAKYGDRWENKLPAETQNYLSKVLGS